MKRKFITFADSRLTGALIRIAKQARAMDFFDEIETLTEKDLDAAYVEENKHLLKRGVRGFGYWIWKPYIIWRALQSMSEGDELYYVDAGCHFNPNGRSRMLEYAEMLRQNELGVAGFELTPDCSVRAFTKMELLVHMGVNGRDDLLPRSQICATHVFVRKNAGSMAFLEEWVGICRDIQLVDDSPSELPDLPGFVEHRHDQSVFSILCMLYGAALLPGRETWPENNTRDWSTMMKYPIWDKRDLGISLYTLERLVRKIRKKWAKLFSRRG